MAQTPHKRRWLRWFLIGMPVLLAVVFIGLRMMFAVPDGLDLADQKATDAGLYQVSLTPNAGETTVGPIQQWTIFVMTPEGTPIDGATVGIDGGMPQHGHGMPTTPQVTDDLGNGGYLVEGMKFSMGGWWTMKVTVDGPQGLDAVTFNIVL